MRLLLAALLLPLLIVPGAAVADTGVVVDKLLTEVQKTLIKVRDAGDEIDLPPLEKATLNLKTSLVAGGNGKISLFIIEFGSDVSKESVQELQLVLEPPKDSDVSPVSAASDTLAEAIISAATAVVRAKNQQPPLRLAKLTASVSFVVKTDTGGGVSFAILPITVDLGAQVATESAQQIVLVFGG